MNSEEPDLDERLRRLFADDRLTLPVSQEAEEAVVAGARRRRRRRLALASSSGVLAVAAAVFVVAALTSLGRGHGPLAAAGPHLSETPDRVTTESPTPATTWPAGLLNEAGVDGLRLGMSEAQVNVALRGSPIDRPIGMVGKCADYELMFPAPPSAGAVATTTVTPDSIARKETFGGSSVVMVVVSPEYGVVQIGGTPGVHTPEGVYSGLPRSVIDKAYPSLIWLPTSKASPLTTLGAPVPDQPGNYYVFEIDSGNTVASVWLRHGATLLC